MTFEEAREIARKNIGSVLTRDSTGQFIVRLKNGTVISSPPGASAHQKMTPPRPPKLRSQIAPQRPQLPALYSHPSNPLYSELQYAIQNTSPQLLREWSTRSAKRIGSLLVRRGGNLIMLTARLLDGVWNEVKGLAGSAASGNLSQHTADRAKAAGNALEIGLSKLANKVGAIEDALEQSPQQAAVSLLSLLLAFYAGSGGPDGNGGIPDTDITIMGIGDHRSFLTHSVISGTVIEAVILAMADLVDTVYGQLPAQHHQFWDKLREVQAQAKQPLIQGMSAGISYHLAVDGLLQPAAYKDLPLPLSIEGHQAVFVINAAAEAAGIAPASQTSTKVEDFFKGIAQSFKAGSEAYKTTRANRGKNWSPKMRWYHEQAEAIRQGKK